MKPLLALLLPALLLAGCDDAINQPKLPAYRAAAVGPGKVPPGRIEAKGRPAPPPPLTAALLQRPSGEVEDSTNNGRVAFATAGLLALRGGVPLVADGETVGAVGVAGRNKDNDVLIAKAAAQGFAAALSKP